MNQTTLNICLVVACILSGSCYGANLKDRGDEAVHDLEDCPYPSSATYSLCNVYVKESPAFFQTLVKDVICPSSGVNTYPIQCIRAISLDGDSDAGYARVLSGGGVGFYSTTIRLTSQFGKGLNFNVQVFTNATSSAANTK